MDNVLLWPFLVYIALSLVVVVGMIVVSYFIGQRTEDRKQSDPYESGIETTGSARLRFPSKFYLIAMFFVLFDIESVFIITWAISFRELGWPGYIGILVFTGILIVVLVYEWRTGSLDFEPTGRKILKAFNNLKKKDRV